jgi:hypothetical protein
MIPRNPPVLKAAAFQKNKFAPFYPTKLTLFKYAVYLALEIERNNTTPQKAKNARLEGTFLN